MKLVLFWVNVASLFIPSLLTGLEAKEMMDSEQIMEILYGDLLEELKEAHLLRAASHVPPTMIIEKDLSGKLHYNGYSADACQYLSQAFKFTYSFVNVVEEELEKGGAVEAEGNLLIRNEADISSTDSQVRWKLFSLFDISVPFYTTGLAMIVPWPDEESRLLAPIKPFQPNAVWLTLCVVLLATIFVFTFLPWIYQKLLWNNNNAIRNSRIQQRDFSFNVLSHRLMLAMVANMAGHGGHWPIGGQLLERILLAFWCLASSVLVYAYSSLLISFLTIPTLKPVAKSYDDLIFRNVQGLEPITGKNTMSTKMIAVANQSAELNFWQKRALKFGKFFQEHPENLFTTTQQRFDLMYTGRYATNLNDLMTNSFLSELNTKAGYCRFTVSTKRMEDLLDSHRVFLFRKNWRYTEAMRNKMQWWTDTGLAKYWIKSYQPSAKGCLLQDYKKNAPAIRVLTLKDLSGAFTFLLMGCALSLLVFLIEKIHYYRMMNRRQVVITI